MIPDNRATEFAVRGRAVMLKDKAPADILFALVFELCQPFIVLGLDGCVDSFCCRQLDLAERAILGLLIASDSPGRIELPFQL
jgi:hypothetical protein